MSASETVIIVGAGPSGLTTAYHLKQRGVPSLVLERGATPGATFARMRRSMFLVSPPFFSQLPGLDFPPGSPALLPMRDYHAYLVRYAEHHRLNVRCGAEVTDAQASGAGFTLALAGGASLSARFLVCATGVYSTPYTPPDLGVETLTIPHRHSADYHEPGDLAGRDVLIVGAGLSAQEIALELCAARPVTLAAKHPLKWIPNPLLGLDLHWWAWLPEMLPVRWIPWAAQHLHEPASGAPIRAALKSGAIRVKPGVTRLSGDVAYFADDTHARYEAVVLATGFRPTVSWLHGLAGATDQRVDGAPDGESAAHPGLFFVGFPFLRTFASRYLRGIRRDAAHAARVIAGRLS